MNTLSTAVQEVIDLLDEIAPRALYAVSTHTAGELSPAFAEIRTALVVLRDEPPTGVRA